MGNCDNFFAVAIRSVPGSNDPSRQTNVPRLKTLQISTSAGKQNCHIAESLLHGQTIIRGHTESAQIESTVIDTEFGESWGSHQPCGSGKDVPPGASISVDRWYRTNQACPRVHPKLEIPCKDRIGVVVECS